MRSHIMSKLTHSFVVVMAMACVGLYGSMAADDSAPSRALAASSPADIAAAHGCWSSAAPADMTGRTPGHVVVTFHEQPRYAGPRMVERALEQIFDGVNHGLTVHAFCR